MCIRDSLSVEQVRQIQQELANRKRRLELSLVLYSHQLHPAIQRHLENVDVVYFWTWQARDLSALERNFAAYRKINPTGRTRLGIYMWDFGAGQPISTEAMEHQCLSLIHISEPTRLLSISYAVFCLKKKKKHTKQKRPEF